MKKAILFFTLLLIAIAGKAQNYTINNVVYQILSEEEKTLKVVAFNDTDEEILVPSKVTINGTVYHPTVIGANTLNNCEQICSILLYTPLEKIEAGAFSDCPSLENIEIEKVKEVAMNAFANCIALKTVALPEGIEVFDASFSGCTSLKEIKIPDGPKKLNTFTFWGCSALETVELPATLTEFQATFHGCHKLKTVIFHDGLKVLGDNVFEYCESLQDVTLPKTLEVLGDDAFSQCTSLEHINLPNGLKEIGYRTFDECTALKSIDLPSTLTKIGSYAFKSCTSLEQITIPEAVEKPSEGMFYKCDKLKEVNLPVEWDSYSKYMFQYCYALEYMPYLPNLKSIGIRAFGSCKSLKRVTIPYTLEFLGDYAFENCYEITVVTSELDKHISSYRPFEERLCSEIKLFVKPGTTALYDSEDSWAHLFAYYHNISEGSEISINAYLTEHGTIQLDRTEITTGSTLYPIFMKGSSQQCKVTFRPDPGFKIGLFTLNGVNYLDKIVDNQYTIVLNNVTSIYININFERESMSDVNCDGLVNAADVVSVYNTIIAGK